MSSLALQRCRPPGAAATGRQRHPAAAAAPAPCRLSGGGGAGPGRTATARSWAAPLGCPAMAPLRRSLGPARLKVARHMGPLLPEEPSVQALEPRGAAAGAAEEAPASYSIRQKLDGYYRLLRGWNALPSAALVLLGAWAGAGKTLLALKGLTVWFMAWASGAVAMASCAINDYFDWHIDELNDASKPIPSGLIPPDRALLCACGLYIVLLALACVVPNAGVRLVVAASAALTILYTPLLKRTTFVKNCVVACVIAAAPLAGALAAGAAGPGLRAVVVPVAYLFMSILYREIMMDIQDRRGDGASGVRTLPVVLGPRAALAICACLLAACFALAGHAALAGRGLAWAWAARPAWEGPLRAAALCAAAVALAPSAAATLAVYRSGFGRDQLSRAITVGMSSAGIGTLLLATLV